MCQSDTANNINDPMRAQSCAEDLLSEQHIFVRSAKLTSTNLLIEFRSRPDLQLHQGIQIFEPSFQLFGCLTSNPDLHNMTPI